MSMTDPIADMLTRIRNANTVYQQVVELPASNIKKAIAQTLKEEGFIADYEVIDDNKQGIIKMYLKYGPNREKIITGLRRISKPGLRVYVQKDEVPKVLGGLGIAVMSTSKGIMTDKTARKEGIGGEVLCYIW
jgi:small subunit ribosomal protein S8